MTHSQLPWVKAGASLRDAEGFDTCTVYDKTNTEFVLKCVNNHDAIAHALDVISNFNGGILTSDSAVSMAQIARDTLKQIQEGE